MTTWDRKTMVYPTSFKSPEIPKALVKKDNHPKDL